MVSEVIVVDARDRAIEQMLSACGMRTTSISGGDLTSLAHPSAHQPDVVILDLRGGRPLPPAVSLLKRAHPGTGLLIVASSLESGLMLEAMRAGVTECVPEPLRQPDLEAAITRLVTAHQSVSTGLVFAFVGAKGGVGTTTTVVNVATALAAASPAQVLVIDLHLVYGDAAVFLGAEPRFSVVDALENMQRLDQAFFKSLVTRSKAGPDVLASSDRALAAPGAILGIRQLVEFAARMYRYTVLDVPRSDTAAIDALDAAAKVVIVANQEIPTVRNAARIAEALRLRYGKERVDIIVSRFDPHSEIGQDDVERALGGRLSATLPSDYRLARLALNKGRPLVMENQSKLSDAFRRLAESIADIERPEKTAPSGGFLRRLIGR
ncbi:MAG: AAA family ATPase [Acidobacteria bacterium]|nr:AAA family ATPase [Acidobacteriota bacterium]